MSMPLQIIRHLTFWAGIALICAGLLVFAATPQLASTAEPPPNYLGWGTLLLGFLTLASSYHFKRIEARRADRAEQRETEAHRRRMDDTH